MYWILQSRKKQPLHFNCTSHKQYNICIISQFTLWVNPEFLHFLLSRPQNQIQWQFNPPNKDKNEIIKSITIFHHIIPIVIKVNLPNCLFHEVNHVI